MKKLLFYFVFSSVFLLGNSLWAQDYYYYHEDAPIYLEASDSIVAIQFYDGATFNDKRQILANYGFLKPLIPSDVLPAPDVTLARWAEGISAQDLEQFVAILNSHESIRVANLGMVYPKDGIQQAVTDQLIVGAYPGSLPDLLLVLDQMNIEVVGFDEYNPDIVIASATKESQMRAMAASNFLVENGTALFAEPDFIRLLIPSTTNDPYYNYQWSIENTGSAIQHSGTVDADMDVDLAWAQSTGCPSISIAILDEGVDLTHPDLVGNMLPGFDATGLGGAGAPSGNDAHGTACAGIAAASGDNLLGVAGVAYNAGIVPVRIAYSSGGGWVTSSTWIANSINWAWNTGGADILSNSWGGGSPSTLINTAIDNALANGRGGLGSPVLFATGNNNSSVSYPGNYTPVIGVGAMSMCNERKNPSSCDGENWWGSNYGTEVDVVAPGVKIATTDISGASGYNAFGWADMFNNDFIKNFNGTSSACPNAAGVMGLILSANSGLTAAQARVALESTTEKAGSYTYSTTAGHSNGTWNNQMGYGSVNAKNALDYVTTTYGVASFDAYMKDSPADVGDEPNLVTTTLYLSQAIKVNTTNLAGSAIAGHGVIAHQNPQFGSTNYVYVEVSNRSCVPGGAGDVLKVYFSKASTGLSWPSHWNSYYVGPLLYGDLIGQITLPADLQPGEKITYKMPWTTVPNPNLFGGSEPGHFCMLARFESTIDPMATVEGTAVWANAKNNNNVVWRNVNILNTTGGNIAVPVVRNINPNFEFIELGFHFDPPQRGDFLEFGQVFITPDEQLYAGWLQGGGNAIFLEDQGGVLTMEPGGEARMYEVLAPFEETFPVEMRIQLDTPFDPDLMDSIYTLTITQYDPETGEEVGGVAYQIKTYEEDTPNPPVIKDGVEHIALGDAILTIDQNGLLRVDNIGSSGMDGVRVKLNESEYGVVTFDGFDFSTLPLGANRTIRGFGNVAGENDKELGAFSQTATQEGTMMTTDFSPMDASEYGLKIFNNGELVFDEMFGPDPVEVIIPIPIPCDITDPFWGMGDIIWTILEGPDVLPVQLPDGSIIQGNEIVFTSRVSAPIDYVSQLDVTGMNMESMGIMKTEIGMFHNGHQGKGGARVLAQQGKIELLNMGQGGGVDISTGEVAGWEAVWSLFDTQNLPTGASMMLTTKGSRAGAPNQTLVRTNIEDAGNSAQVGFEFLDSTNEGQAYIVEIWNNGQLVDSEETEDYPQIIMSNDGCGGFVDLENILIRAGINTGTPQQMEIIGHSPVMGQYIVAYPKTAAGAKMTSDIDYISGFNIETNGVGNMTILDEQTTALAPRLAAKVFLDGPYDAATGLMEDKLRTKGLLDDQGIDPAVLAVAGNNAVVDWVYIELRDRQTQVVITTIDGLLQRDGDIVAPDGSSAIEIGLAEGEYFIAIRHRNHLGIMTEQAVNFGRGTTSLDFTNGSVLTYGNNAQGTNNGVFTMNSGDINGDGIVNAADRSDAWNYRNLETYFPSDTNLDGFTDAADRSLTWNKRNLSAQLP